MFKGTGIIQYDPPRPARLARGKDYWCIIKTDRELTRYFRWWVNKELMNVLGFDNTKEARMHGFDLLHPPSFDAHISIVRGFKDARHNMDRVKEVWKKYDGQKVEFTYGLDVRQSGDTTEWDRPDHYWFVVVDCPMVKQIREEMGLITTFRPHITIGRTW